MVLVTGSSSFNFSANFNAKRESFSMFASEKFGSKSFLIIACSFRSLTPERQALYSIASTSKHIVYFDQLGDAILIKISTNLITDSIVQKLSEALTITENVGTTSAKRGEARE